MPEENKPTSGSLFNFSLSDIFGAGKGIEKLAATVGGGAGRVADGVAEVANVKWLDKSRADNDAYRTQVVGDAQTRVMEGRARAVAALAREGQHLQNMSITEGGIAAQLTGLSVETRDLHERALRRMMYENAMQQLNRETVTAHAAAELAGDEQVTDEPVAADWSTRFFRVTQDISDEQMQLILGKILAGEVKEPGSFSMRTIDVLSTLRREEAELFKRICSFSWRKLEDRRLVVFEDGNETQNIGLLTFGELQHLREIGLIEVNTSTFSNGYQLISGSVTMHYNGQAISIETVGPDGGGVPIGKVLLTNTGREIARVCQPIFNSNILEYTVAMWERKGCKVTRLPG